MVVLHYHLHLSRGARLTAQIKRIDYTLGSGISKVSAGRILFGRNSRYTPT